MQLLHEPTDQPGTASKAEARGNPLSVSMIGGGLVLAVGERPLPLAGRKARAILAFLAIEAERPVRRERLATLFWSESPERHARNSLRQTLFEIKEALDRCGCEVLRRDRDELGLDRTMVRLDLDGLLDAIADGEVPETLFRPGVGTDLLLAGYEDLSPDFDTWVTTTRRSCQDRLIRALEAAYRSEAHAPALRRRYAEAVLQLEPLHEQACRTVMRLAVGAGEIGAALRVYATLYETMGLHVDSEPSTATQELVAAIKMGQLDPPTPAAAAIPAQASSTGRTSVAVLPLLPAGPEPQTRWIADGISEDVVRMLAGLREPAVISSNSTRHISPDRIEPPEIGRRLGATYLVCGSVRLGNGGGRVSIELLDAATATVLWSEAYAIGAEQDFGVQEVIAARIAHALAPRVNASELRRSLGRRPADLHAYHLLLQARDILFHLERETFAAAGDLIAEALRREPTYPGAHAARADWLSLRVFQGWSNDAAADTAALMQAAETAIRLDPHHGRALALLGHNRMLAQHRFDEAEELLRRAVASAPNDAEVLLWSSPTCAYVGKVDEAVSRAEQALLLSPEDPFRFRYEHFLSLAHYAAEDFGRAAEWGLRSWLTNPNYTSNLRITAAALAAMGRFTEAAPLVERHRLLHPRFRAEALRVRHEFRQPAKREALAAQLSRAGLD